MLMPCAVNISDMNSRPGRNSAQKFGSSSFGAFFVSSVSTGGKSVALHRADPIVERPANRGDTLARRAGRRAHGVRDLAQLLAEDPLHVEDGFDDSIFRPSSMMTGRTRSAGFFTSASVAGCLAQDAFLKSLRDREQRARVALIDLRAAGVRGDDFHVQELGEPALPAAANHQPAHERLIFVDDQQMRLGRRVRCR